MSTTRMQTCEACQRSVPASLIFSLPTGPDFKVRPHRCPGGAWCFGGGITGDMAAAAGGMKKALELCHRLTGCTACGGLWWPVNLRRGGKTGLMHEWLRFVRAEADRLHEETIWLKLLGGWRYDPRMVGTYGPFFMLSACLARVGLEQQWKATSSPKGEPGGRVMAKANLDNLKAAAASLHDRPCGSCGKPMKYEFAIKTVCGEIPVYSCPCLDEQTLMLVNGSFIKSQCHTPALNRPRR